MRLIECTFDNECTVSVSENCSKVLFWYRIKNPQHMTLNDWIFSVSAIGRSEYNEYGE